GYGEVGFSIAIKVAHRDRRRSGSRTVFSGRLKNAVAIAQQHRDATVECTTGYSEIKFAVAIEVLHDNRSGRCRGVVDPSLEGAVAVAQQHRDVTGAIVGRSQVKLAITIEIAR